MNLTLCEVEQCMSKGVLELCKDRIQNYYTTTNLFFCFLFGIVVGAGILLLIDYLRKR